MKSSDKHETMEINTLTGADSFQIVIDIEENTRLCVLIIKSSH